MSVNFMPGFRKRALILALAIPVTAAASEDILAEFVRVSVGASAESKAAVNVAPRPAAQAAAPVKTTQRSQELDLFAAFDQPKASPKVEAQPVKPLVQPAQPMLQAAQPTVQSAPQPVPTRPQQVTRQASSGLLSFAPATEQSKTAEVSAPVVVPAAVPASAPQLDSSVPHYITPAMEQPLQTPYQPDDAPVLIDRSGGTDVKQVFNRAVLQALRVSPLLNSSRAQAEAAQAGVSEAKGQRWPQVDVSSSSKSLFFGGGNRPNQGSSDLPALNVNVATTLYDFGQNSNTIESREKQAQASDIEVQAQQENLAWQMSSAMIELVKQQQIIEINQDYVRRMNELTQMLKGIVQVDPGRRSELTQATGKLLQAQSVLDTSVAKARDQEIILNRLSANQPVKLPTSTRWDLGTPNVDQQLRQIEQHPVIRKAMATAEAAMAEAAVVRSSGMPKLNWVISKNTGRDYYGDHQPFQTGLQLSWPLFRGGSTNAAEKAALARAEASRQQIEEQHRDLSQRVRAADQDASSLLKRATLYQNLVSESDRIRKAFFEQWYHLGKRTLLDVLGAETDYYNNQVSEVSSRFDGYAAIFRGYASAGELQNWLSKSQLSTRTTTGKPL